MVHCVPIYTIQMHYCSLFTVVTAWASGSVSVLWVIAGARWQCVCVVVGGLEAASIVVAR